MMLKCFRYTCIACLLCLLVCPWSVGNAAVPQATEGDSIGNFSPCAGVVVTASVSKEWLKFSVRISGSVVSDNEVSLDIESQPHLSIEDYNFDGLLDFSLWYVDEGMGTSSIHRVFLFDPKEMKFSEATPRCADEFLNLRLDKVRRRLISTAYKQNEPSTCETFLEPLAVSRRGAEKSYVCRQSISH